MELQSLFHRVIGLDVHQAQVTACAILTDPDGNVTIERRQFGAFQKDRKTLALWCASHRPDTVVMESTGIYWKSPYAALEKVGVQAQVVNARHVKQVPGRKTDVEDAEWLATLASGRTAAGLLCSPGTTAGAATDRARYSLIHPWRNPRPLPSPRSGVHQDPRRQAVLWAANWRVHWLVL